jgi:hypothetical protein
LIKIVWFVPQPSADIEGFEHWYQKTHAPIGMRQEFLQRFRIARAWMPQPRFVQEANGDPVPPIYRLPEGYWHSMEDIHACYRSVHAMAALGDGALNAVTPPVPGPPRPVLFVRETELAAGGKLCFDPASGEYESAETTKLWAFVRLIAGAPEFDEAYGKIGEPPAVLKRHVLGSCQDETVTLGRAAQWPPKGAERFDRTLEYYVDGPSQVEDFAATDFFKNVLKLLDERAERVLWVAVRIQETFYTREGDMPLEDGWKQISAQAATA